MPRLLHYCLEANPTEMQPCALCALHHNVAEYKERTLSTMSRACYPGCYRGYVTLPLILYPLLFAETNCPLDNYDVDFAKFLKKYFPKEIKSKQIDLQNAAGEEKFGIYYSRDSGNHHCQVM